MKARLAAAAVLLGGLSAPAPVLAQDATRQLVELTPMVQIVNPRQWAGVEQALRASGVMTGILEQIGYRITPAMFHAQVADLIAGGAEELFLLFIGACGNSGCWTFILEFRDGRLVVVAETVLPETFVIARAAGETYGSISGYRHGLRWDGRRWVQFCTDTRYCG